MSARLERLESRLAMATVSLPASFDFGTSRSPVAKNFTQVTERTAYSASRGFGWTSGTIYSVDRSVGSLSDRDLAYTKDGTFGVDLPRGQYQVDAVFGDLGNYPHDQVGIFLEGMWRDTVDTPGRRSVSRSYSTLVTDGQLTLRIKDLGGRDPSGCIMSLKITAVPSFRQEQMLPGLSLTIPSRAVTENQVAPLVATLARSGPIDSPLTINLTSSDISSLSVPSTVTIPGGSAVVNVALTTVNNQQPNGSKLVTITATAVGMQSSSAQLRIADDEQPLSAMFDFGTASSAVGPGYQGVSERTTYSPSLGYGWTNGQIYSLDRGGTSAVLRDFNYTSSGTFVVDIPDGTYVVDLIMGDTGGVAHDQMGIEIEDRLVDTLSTVAGGLVARRYTINVMGGQLSLLLRDLGGEDSSVTIQALRINPVSANLGGTAWWPASLDIPNALFSEATRDSSGVIYYSVYSPYQRTANTIRVLLPRDYSPDRPYPVIYVLPVEAGLSQKYGDGLNTVRSLGINTTKQAIFVAPTFSNLPWYVDNSRDSSNWQETYFKNIVIPFVESQYAVLPGPEGRLLLGFSKSGYGAVSMLLRAPDYFGKAVAWDAPVNMRDANSLPGFADALGDPSNYGRNYRISTLLARNGDALKNQAPRIFLLGYSYSFTREDLQNIANLMTSLKIPVVYSASTYRKHHWNSGWVAEAVNYLLA